MRILHVITSLGSGGAQTMLRSYLEALGPLAGDHQVAALQPGGRLGQEIKGLGVPVVELGVTSGRHLPAAAARLRRLIATGRPDVVHGWMYHGCLAATLCAGFGPSVVWGIHHSLADLSNESARTRLLLRAMVPLSRRADAITYCGSSIADQHERMGFQAGRRVVIANGVDCSTFRPRAGAHDRLLAELGLPSGRLLIGSLARNHPMKDPATLVRAVARLIAEGVDAQAVFLGEGQVDGLARLAARRCGIDERVTTLEARAQVAELVAGLDIFVLSSAWGEAFSLAMAEAMAAGVPVVSTDVGDAAWLVGDTSRLVPPQDDVALAAVLDRLARSRPEERRMVGQSDRDRVASLFSLERYVAAHDALYGQLANVDARVALA